MPKREFDKPPDDDDHEQQQREADVVEDRLVREIDEPGKLAAPIDRQPVVGAIAVEADGDVVDHLREGERDHDEIHAACSQRQRADQKREQAGDDQRNGPLHEARRDALIGEDADDIAADPEIGRVAETHHAAVAHDEIEADGSDREDDDPREQDHHEVVADPCAVERHEREHDEQRRHDDVAQGDVGCHRLAAGKRPSGRTIRMIAIKR